MNVGLVLEPIDRGSPGFRNYAYRLMRALLEDGRHDYRLIHRRPSPLIDDPREYLMPGIPGGPLSKQLAQPFVLGRLGLDLMHDVYHFPPYLFPSPYARVMTIGDLTPLLLETHTSKNVLWHRLLVGRLARRCHHIVTFSECSKRDIVRLLRVAPERITVTHLAADEGYAPGSSAAALTELRRHYQLPSDRFFLQVGTLEPRKNLRATLAAFSRIATQAPDTALVVVGPDGWGESNVEELARSAGVAHRVVAVGKVPDEHLVLFYRAALALVYPSLYEGFGLPPLEAMQSGCPVVSSNAASLPEVVGEAALLVAPDDIEGIASAMSRLARDPQLCSSLSEGGIQRARLFSWKRTADATLAGYERALTRPGRVAEPSVESLL